jgi:Cu+-exporting ATPase
MEVARTDAAHMALMRDSWMLVPDAFAIAHRTTRVVKINIEFTVLCNLVGLSLDAVGMLPPIVAAAQSLPDLGILANSAQLLRQLPCEDEHSSKSSILS